MQDSSCLDCPRECGVARESTPGWCELPGYEAWISSICLHRGEEPILGGEQGVANIFFAHCNLACVYCQNQAISARHSPLPPYRSLDKIIQEIEALIERGARAVGFVSPSHQARAVTAIIKGLKSRGHRLPLIWNSSGYDKLETLRAMEPLIDIWLPDFKYSDPRLARSLSGAEDYPEVALRALREIYRQKGSTLEIDAKGLAVSGLIIRHLVLPGEIPNSLDCLRLIASDLSPRVSLSLMSQYHPLPGLAPPLDRPLRPAEYREVTDLLEELGFCQGWVQKLESHAHYLPDFRRVKDPFGLD